MTCKTSVVFPTRRGPVSEMIWRSSAASCRSSSNRGRRNDGVSRDTPCHQGLYACSACSNRLNNSPSLGIMSCQFVCYISPTVLLISIYNTGNEQQERATSGEPWNGSPLRWELLPGTEAARSVRRHRVPGVELPLDLAGDVHRAELRPAHRAELG